MRGYADLVQEAQRADFLQLCDAPELYREKAEGSSFDFVVTDKDKAFRGELHANIKKNMKGYYSETNDVEDKKIITAKYVGKEDMGRYLRFVLRKRNWDTMQAVNQVARGAKKNTGNFFFAGTKDKRGETVQWVTAKNVAKKELAGFTKMKYWKWEEISFSNLEYVSEPIKLGDLKGNKFTIALRLREPAAESLLNENVSNVRENGFINYFGLQRFGTKSKVS